MVLVRWINQYQRRSLTSAHSQRCQFQLHHLPAIVLRNMRYSKFEISRRCHFWVMLEFLISCRGDIMEARLQQQNSSKVVFAVLNTSSTADKHDCEIHSNCN